VTDVRVVTDDGAEIVRGRVIVVAGLDYDGGIRRAAGHEPSSAGITSGADSSHRRNTGH
jgi:hypothetical protein